MVDKNKDGIDDSKQSSTPLADAQAISAVEKFFSGLQAQNTDGPTSTTDKSTVKSVIRLDKNSAKALMTAAAEDAGYIGKFTEADIAEFMKSFEAEQNRNIGRVVTSSSGTRVPGATSTATTENIIKQEYPSFFQPAEFVKDWIWSKVNFADEKTLGTKALTALAQARGIVDSFQVLGIDPKRIESAAKQIAMGKLKVADFTVEVQQQAIKEYPQFAERFKLDPTLTTYDIASPVVSLVAKTLNKNVKDISMSHPVVLAYMRSAGADGKGQAPSFYDLELMTKKLPEYQETPEANKAARDSAESLGRALGYGV